MRIIKCSNCGMELVEGYLYQCPQCWAVISPPDENLKRYDVQVKYIWRKYHVENLEYLCAVNNVTVDEVLEELAISKADMENFRKMKDDNPVIAKLAGHFGMKGNYFMYNKLSLPEGCRDVSQKIGMDVFMMKLMTEAVKTEASKWKRFTPNEGNYYKQIGFKYEGQGYTVILTARGYSDPDPDYSGFRRYRMFDPGIYATTNLLIYGDGDSFNKALRSDYNMQECLLDVILDGKDICYSEWDTIPEYRKERSHTTTRVSKMPQKINELAEVITRMGEQIEKLASASSSIKSEAKIEVPFGDYMKARKYFESKGMTIDEAFSAYIRDTAHEYDRINQIEKVKEEKRRYSENGTLLEYTDLPENIIEKLYLCQIYTVEQLRITPEEKLDEIKGVGAVKKMKIMEFLSKTPY